MDELIQALMNGAGVNEDQAKGGAGSIVKWVKDNLGSGEFAKLAGMVPGLDTLAEEAPSSSGGGGLLGALGGLAGAFGGGGGAAGNLGSLSIAGRGVDSRNLRKTR